MDNNRLNKKMVRWQFGANATSYANSPVHARGASLKRLVELVKPQNKWKMLDVATGSGNTAFTFAPYVGSLLAIDITPEMLFVAKNQASDLSFQNISFMVADGEKIPLEAATIDLVTCRIATHHFSNILFFLQESARVLKPGGTLAIVDNIVPGPYDQDRKAKESLQVDGFVNSFERFRDPSHVRCLNLDEWRQLFFASGIVVKWEETLTKEMDFFEWANRMSVSPSDLLRLKAMLIQAPRGVLDFLDPKFSNEKITFSLTEAIIIGQNGK